jgi:hypothetical protein
VISVVAEGLVAAGEFLNDFDCGEFVCCFESWKFVDLGFWRRLPARGGW